MNKSKIVVLISGHGSTLQSFIDAIAQDTLHVDIAAVISNHADAYGLERAKLANIPTHVIAHTDFATRSAFDEALQQQIDYYHPDLVVLAGFMRILSPAFVQHFAGRLINIHPSLLPNYRGTHTYERALAAKEKFHGTTVHFVTDELDGGPIIAQASLPILPDDTPETLKARTQEIEQRLYPEVIEKLVKSIE